jgi:predicted amidohydrolase YtcJ
MGSRVDRRADMVLLGGLVFTVDPTLPRAEAVGVLGGRIVFVGSAGDARELIGPNTRVFELNGGMVLPGFQDGHVHPLHGGLARMRCELHGLQGAEAYVHAVREYATAHPDAAWILGGGWALDAFPRGTPHRSLLDGVVPDRPVVLSNRDGHGIWVNTRALEMAGITRDTPDPADGRIERDQDGEPQGTLHEGAMDLARRLVPPTTRADLAEALRLAQAYLHSLGITAWQEAIVESEDLEAYFEVVARGELSARVVGALWWDRARGEEQVSDLVAMRARAAGMDGRFRATTVKIMQDGVIENFTASVLQPYLDDSGIPTANRGLSFLEADSLKRAITRLDGEGFQVHVHAIGERAVREALDGFEGARSANGARDLRHHIAHIQVIHPDDVPRFASLGVVANAQPYWACLDGQMRDLTIPFLGPERTGWQYPFASLRRAGATLAFGSDWPVSTADPLKEIQVAVTRVSDDDFEAPVFLPDERLELATALEAFTKGSAFVNHLDSDTGTIDVGKAADLVVLDRNLFNVRSSEIGQARVLLTLIEGEPVHAAAGWGW